MIPESERWWEGRQTTDVLDTISQLPNDEILTPPAVARQVLRILPEDVWSNHTLTWCDPFCKSGVFLREIYSRLMQSLSSWEPDPNKRREHILRKMLFASAITDLLANVTRRTLYQSFDATGASIVDPEAKTFLVEFDNPQGNVWYERGEHVFKPGSSTCLHCGGQKKVIELERENFAYPLLHNRLPFGGTEMKFDIIVGNPPYQIGMKDDKGERTKNITPLYNRFIEKAIELDPKFLLMVTPSRWFTAGKNLSLFREKMLADRRMRKIVDYPNGREIFPTVEVKGGISFFLWDRDHDADCDFVQVSDGKLVSQDLRDLRDGEGVLVRDMTANAIVDKVRSHKRCESRLSESVSTQDPFGAALKTNYALSKEKPFSGSIPLIYKHKIGYITNDQIPRNHEWIKDYKVLLPKASDGKGAREGLRVLGEPIALAPGSVCTQSYLVAGRFGSPTEARNFAKYLTTKFVRFLVLQRKTTQDLIPDRFKFVPELTMDEEWTDPTLFELFGLGAKEIDYIERTIAEREWIDSLDTPIPKTHQPGGSKYKQGSQDDDELEEDEDY